MPPLAMSTPLAASSSREAWAWWADSASTTTDAPRVLIEPSRCWSASCV